MKKPSLSLISSFLAVCILLSGCQNSSGAVWEDTKTMGRYLQRKGKLLWRKDVDSRMVETADDFTGPSDEEFIPLKDEDLKTQFAHVSIPQPAQTPGAKGSPVPSIDHFSSPTGELASMFKNVYFNTDEHVVKRRDDMEGIDRIAAYMKKNPNLYIFVSGHCDERASEAYNLALGTRRANMIRSMLVKKGVNPNHIYTISFGKEMPLDKGHAAESWSKNRRAEFKIFKKES